MGLSGGYGFAWSSWRDNILYLNLLWTEFTQGEWVRKRSAVFIEEEILLPEGNISHVVLSEYLHCFHQQQEIFQDNSEDVPKILDQNLAARE